MTERKAETLEEGDEVLERGDIYFAYRPRVEAHDPDDLGDVQRSYVILHPEGRRNCRLIVMGGKRLPAAERHGQPLWGFVDVASKDPKRIAEELRAGRYGTKTRGEREVPAARPAGEGVYAIVRHGRTTRLVYMLELPKRPGDVQHELNVGEEGSYVLTVKNPEAGRPQGRGLSEERRARFPKKLQERFGGRKFVAVDPPDFLDHEGAEMLFVAAHEAVGDEFKEILGPERESESSAEIMDDLRLRKSKRPLEPLIKGEWR